MIETSLSWNFFVRKTKVESREEFLASIVVVAPNQNLILRSGERKMTLQDQLNSSRLCLHQLPQTGVASYHDADKAVQLPPLHAFA
mgnify:CR=1 FL=1